MTMTMTLALARIQIVHIIICCLSLVIITVDRIGHALHMYNTHLYVVISQSF